MVNRQKLSKFFDFKIDDVWGKRWVILHLTEVI